MKLVPCETGLERKYTSKTIELLKEVEESISKQYDNPPTMMAHFYKLKYLEDFLTHDSKILEVGCGAINSRDNFLNRKTYEPWFLRSLHGAGYNCTGIDICEKIHEEQFSTHISDLSKPNSLYHIEDNSIDIAMAFAFFDAPSYERQTPDKNNLYRFNLIAEQLERIVKSEGVFIYQNLEVPPKQTLENEGYKFF